MYQMKSNRRPPLPKSPTLVRTRRVLRSNSASLQTPPGSLTKSQKPIRTQEVEESQRRPEYNTISCELRALARMVHDEIGNGDTDNNFGIGFNSLSANSSPLFERGRFYDEYSARRNERLKRKKKVETGEEGGKTPYNLGVTVEPTKRRGDSKRLESLRRSVSAAYSVERSENPRYMLRSMSKENKKPPLALNGERSVIASERKIGARRVGRS